MTATNEVRPRLSDDQRPAVSPSRPRRAPVRAGTIGRVLTLCAVAALVLFFMVSFLIAAFRTQSGLTGGGLTRTFSWGNLRYDWDQIHGFGGGVFTNWYVNSAIVSIGGTLIALAAGVPAGYALARLSFPFRRTILITTLLTMVIPNTVLVIPLFLEVSSLHQVGRLWPVAVILGFFPFGTYLSFLHFDSALPHELLESARMDGLSEIGIFLRIALPVSRQAVAIVAFFAFLSDWTNYFLPLVLLPLTSKSTLTVGLQQMISDSQLYDPTAAAGSPVSLYMPQLIFAALLQTIPLLLLFLVCQRFLVRGSTLGAVKG